MSAPRDPRNGDFATNIAMRLAKSAGKNPRELAQIIIDALPVSPLIDKVEIAGPGFINFHLGAAAFHDEVATIVGEGERYGRQALRETPKVLLEFVSANPTGRCMSATAGTPATALRSATFWRPPATRSTGSITSTMPAARWTFSA